MFELSPLFRAQRAVESESFIAHAGQGSDRQTIELDRSQLLTCLLSGCKPTSLAALKSNIAFSLSLDSAQSEKLLNFLIDGKVIIPSIEADRLRSEGALWEEWGWRDAFDFHWAGRDLGFDNLDPEEYKSAVDLFLKNTDQVGSQPGPYKEISANGTLSLSELVPAEHPWRSLGTALLTNWQVGTFNERGLEVRDIAQVLRAALGVQREIQTELGPHVLKTSPSGGARHPVEGYVASRWVNGLSPGVYHYDAGKDSLSAVNGPEALEDLNGSCYEKEGICTASAVLFLTVRWMRHNWKYRYSRSYRMVLIDVGHVIQTVCLAGDLVDVDVYSTYAIHDELIANMLALGEDCEESPMFALGLGRGASR
jgi:SagB-type dehydrogenase family enzyme